MVKRRTLVESSESDAASESEEDDVGTRRRLDGRSAFRPTLESESESESESERASVSLTSPPIASPKKKSPTYVDEPNVPVPRDIGTDASSASSARPLRLKGTAEGPKFELHAELATRLYDHQRDGIRWMWGLHLAGRGGILADDMGLGKTLQACAFVTGLLRSGAAKRVLVLAPTTLLPHWLKEFETCGLKEGKTVFKYYSGTQSSRERNLRACVSGRGVLLASYGMVTTRASELGAPSDDDEAMKAMGREGRGGVPRDFAGTFRWDWVVMDEGHTLKNPATQLAQKVRQIPANLRMIVTGTPVQNVLSELWSLYDLTCPGLLGGENDFRRQFANKITAGQAASATQKQRAESKELTMTLRQLTRPYFLRREKSEILAKDDAKEEVTEDLSKASSSSMSWKNVKNVPSALGQKNDFIAWIPLDPAQRALYTNFLASRPIQDAINKTGSAIACMNTLKKICDHPSLCVGAQAEDDSDAVTTEGPVDHAVEEDVELRKSCSGEAAAAVAAAVRECNFDSDALSRGSPSLSAKSKFLMSMLERFRIEGHRTLVFSQSQATLDIIEANIREANIDFVRIDGKVNVDERDRRVTKFRSQDDIPVMLLTARVGGLGLTLTEATRVIIFDPAWNPTTDNQSVDRAYRIGQTKDVVVYRMVTCGTIEEKVYRRQVFKGSLSKACTDGVSGRQYFDADDASQMFEMTEHAASSSETMKQLNMLHAIDRKWTNELRREIPYVESLPCVCGVSDHDLLFSKEDEAVAPSQAAPKQSTGGVTTTPKGKAPGGAAWKDVNSAWGGDGGLLGGAFLRALTPSKGPSSAAKEKNIDVDEKSPEHVSGEAKLRAKIDLIASDVEKQRVILSMPDVVDKIPDKGESVRKAIETKLAEKRVLEAEYDAKYTKAEPVVVKDEFFTPEGSPEVQATLESVRSLSLDPRTL